MPGCECSEAMSHRGGGVSHRRSLAWWWLVILISYYTTSRSCIFPCCLLRLLNFDADKWVHLNCALWSNEVYETMNGALMYVDLACKRGASIECVICHKFGATAGCFRPRCPNVYHVACAQQDNVTFFEDKVNVCC